MFSCVVCSGSGNKPKPFDVSCKNPKFSDESKCCFWYGTTSYCEDKEKSDKDFEMLAEDLIYAYKWNSVRYLCRGRIWKCEYGFCYFMGTKFMVAVNPTIEDSRVLYYSSALWNLIYSPYSITSPTNHYYYCLEPEFAIEDITGEFLREAIKRELKFQSCPELCKTGKYHVENCPLMSDCNCGTQNFEEQMNSFFEIKRNSTSFRE